MVSVHIGGSPLLLAAASVLGLLALTARGPMGVVRVCGARLHAVLDVTAGILLAASPLVPALRPGIVGIVAVELVAVAWLRVVTLTRYTAGVDRRAPTDGADAATTARATAGSGAGAEGAPPAPTISAVRRLGRMTAGARTRLPEAGRTLDSSARRMGGHAGRLQRAWRRTTH